MTAPVTAETAEEIKARGAFYTPVELTEFVARWAIRSHEDRVLEPSCGDGAFIVTSADRLRALGQADLSSHLFGVELEDGEAVKSRALEPTADIRTLSFFDADPADFPTIDAVVGNPPYIRYHGFTGENRKRGLERASAQGVKLTQLASSWAHFVIHSAAFLPEGSGRIALVVPAELLHTEYAEPVRQFLLERFTSVVIVSFDRNIFEDAQVDAVLLLASNDEMVGMRLIRVHDGAALTELDVSPTAGATKQIRGARWSSTLDADAEAIYHELIAAGTAQKLSEIASVDIGVVTGANKFFIMSESESTTRGLPAAHLTPIVQRPGDVPGLSLKQAETRLLLDLRGRGPVTDDATLAYLATGIELGIEQGYKCRTRTPWYAVPLPRVRPDAFIPYMNHHATRLIVNTPKAWSTNLIHGVAFKKGAPHPKAVSAAMLSAVTWLSAEIEGRAYGGGVLKLETKEAERLLVPKLDKTQEASLKAAFPRLDRLVRAGDLEAASALVDGILDIDHERFLTAYHVYRSRRMSRKLNGLKAGVAVP